MTKAKRKVKLPVDKTGAPIRIGDVLEWSDGTRMKVSVLNYFGGGYWTMETEDYDFSDNLGASLVVWRGKGKR